MKKTFILFLSLFIILGSITVYADNGQTTVYITKTGKKYHKETCSSLSKSKKAVTLEKAYIDLGLNPCSKCKPPKYNGSKTRKNKKSNSIKVNTGAICPRYFDYKELVNIKKEYEIP